MATTKTSAKPAASKLVAKPPKAASNGVHPSKHPTVAKIGLSALKGQIAQSKHFVTVYESIIADLDAAHDSSKFWGNMVLAAQLTAGMCDGFVAVLGEITGPAGEKWKTGYGHAKNFAPIVGGVIAGQGVQGAALAKAVGASGAGALKGKVASMPGLDKGAGKTIMELNVDSKLHIGNMVIDKINGDDESAADELKKGGRTLGIAAVALKSEAMGKVLSVYNELNDAGESLGKAMSEWDQQRTDDKQYFASQKRGLLAKVRLIKEKIRVLEQQVAALQKASSASPQVTAKGPPLAWKPGMAAKPGHPIAR